MSLTQEHIRIVKKTWRIFRSVDPVIVADTFYSKLFNDTPSLRSMFPKDMQKQYLKLMDMLSTIIARLDNLQSLVSEIKAMAQRHVQYGVRPANYKLVGKALLWTLQKGLGKDWNEEVKDAWEKCYTTLANTMIDASTEEPAH